MIRPLAASRIDGACGHCLAAALVSIRFRYACNGIHAVAVLCSICTTAATWGPHDLDEGDRAELRKCAHRVGQLRGGA